MNAIFVNNSGEHASLADCSYGGSENCKLFICEDSRQRRGAMETKDCIDTVIFSRRSGQ